MQGNRIIAEWAAETQKTFTELGAECTALFGPLANHGWQAGDRRAGCAYHCIRFVRWVAESGSESGRICNAVARQRA